MRHCLPLLLLLCLLLPAQSATPVPDWGFWAHRRINRLAVFTLPPEMIVFYKRHLEYITEHAVDPDKRRYATRFEAVRHYIDIDHWGTFPFDNIPRGWTETLAKFSDVYLVNAAQDTLQLLGDSLINWQEYNLTYMGNDPKVANLWRSTQIQPEQYLRFFSRYFLPQYYEEQWTLDCSELRTLFGDLELDCQEVFAVDRFSEYGILPYNLMRVQEQLTSAFRSGNLGAILRISAELGHYIGDAHVPLHTTTNYNGQLTDQVGIHAFWESRIPELFADEQYNYFVGPALYQPDTRAFFWDMVLDSHVLVDSVLQIEKQLSQEFPRDQQYCFEERLGRTIRTQCKVYAAAYQERLNGMIEARMRQTILAVGSAWYTAWVNAGQPDLRQLESMRLSADQDQALRELENAYRNEQIKGRRHD